MNGIFRVAVPIFLLINGYYFCSVISKGKQFSWLKRLLLLYIFWMILCSFFWLKNIGFSVVEFVLLVKIVIFGYGHLWYISGLIISVMLLLILRRLSFLALFFVIITFISAVIFQYLNNYYVFKKLIMNEIVKSYLYISAFSFFALGYSTNRFDLYDEVSGKVLILLSLIGSITLLGEVSFNYIGMGLRKGVDIYLSLICPVIFFVVFKIECTRN